MVLFFIDKIAVPFATVVSVSWSVILECIVSGEPGVAGVPGVPGEEGDKAVEEETGE